MAKVDHAGHVELGVPPECRDRLRVLHLHLHPHLLPEDPPRHARPHHPQPHRQGEPAKQVWRNNQEQIKF